MATLVVLTSSARAEQPAPPAVQPAAFTESPADAEEQLLSARAAAQFAETRGGDPKALAQVIQLTRGLRPADAAAAFDELAAAHERARQLTLAADVRRTLAAMFPQEPLAGKSVRWLIELYASSEIGYAHRQVDVAKQAIAQQLASTKAQAVPSASDQYASTGGPVAAAYGLHLANQAARANPALDDDLALRFQRYVAARRAGDEKVANKFLAPLNRANAPEPWGTCARTEIWLETRPARPAPKQTLAVVATAVKRPQLDGVLDEPLWQGEKEGEKVSGTFFGASPQQTEIRLAYDAEFLYIAIRAATVPGVPYEPDALPRSHDADLSPSDCVRLRIDLDRDYSSWFELVVDSQGRTADRCGNDAAWNPEWYVAPGEVRTGEDRFSGPAGPGDHWTIEAAIPFASLTDHPPSTGAAWACAIDRITPNAAPQPWCGPSADAATPDSFGLLLFQ